MHDRLGRGGREDAVRGGGGVEGEVPRVDRVAALHEAVRGVPPLRVGGHVVDRPFEAREGAREPGVVARRPVAVGGALHDEVLHVRLDLQADEGHIVGRVEPHAVGRHVAPVAVVELLDELVELPVRALRVEDEVEEAREVVPPVPLGLHDVDVVADPVEVAAELASVHEDELPPRVDRAAQRLHEVPERRVVRRHDAGDREFHVVVGPAPGARALRGPLARQLFGEHDQPPFVEPVPRPERRHDRRTGERRERGRAMRRDHERRRARQTKTESRCHTFPFLPSRSPHTANRPTLWSRTRAARRSARPPAPPCRTAGGCAPSASSRATA